VRKEKEKKKKNLSSSSLEPLDGWNEKEGRDRTSAKEIIIIETIDVEAASAVVLPTREDDERMCFCNLAPIVCNEDDSVCVVIEA
jgi:hypothetical protein